MDTAQRIAAALGIDFGTHHTVATVVRVDGRRHQLLFDGSPLLPSGIYIDSDTSILVGRDAVREGRRHPERYERNPKLRIGSPSILLGTEEVPVREAVSAVLGRVLNECARVAGPPQRVTVTVPAGWGPARRHVIGDAAASTGAAALTLLPEPVAAARYFVEVLGHEPAEGRPVVVFDLGAGTFDASVVARTGAGYEVLAVDGSDRIGGHYLDQAIVEYLGGRYESSEDSAERWRALIDPESGAERQRLRFALYDEVREAKERLSRAVTTDVVVPGFAAEELLTRSEVELLARPLLEQAVTITRAVIREAGLEPERLAGIFMVGGASRMPLATTMLHRELGVAPTLIEQPELVVSEGAVIAEPAPTRPMPVAPPVPTQAVPAGPPPATQAMPPHTGHAPAPSPVRDRRSPALILGIVALAIAVIAGGASLINAYGDQSPDDGVSFGGDTDEPTGDAVTGPDEAAEDEDTAGWDSVSITDIEADASSITVFTDADDSLTGCTVHADGAVVDGSGGGGGCGEVTVSGLYASDTYRIELYGPGRDENDPDAEPLVRTASTDTVEGQVYWSCPEETLQYCREQGGDPGISAVPQHTDEGAVGYAVVGDVYSLYCYEQGQHITPRGESDVDPYHDFHEGKDASDLWVRIVDESEPEAYIPFVWLIIVPDDLNSTGDLPAC